MHQSKRTTLLIAALLAVIAVLACAVIFLLAKPARPEEPVYQTIAPTLAETVPAATEPPQAQPDAALTSGDAAAASDAEITDPDFYAQDRFWPDDTPQQKVSRTADAITVSLFDMEGREYRRAVIHLTPEGGYASKETTLFDEKGNPVEYRVTTAQGLTTAMTTWAYAYDEEDRLLSAICQMSSGDTPRTEDRYTYFADGSWEWEHKAYRTEGGQEILWHHFLETCDAKGTPLSRETLVEDGSPL